MYSRCLAQIGEMIYRLKVDFEKGENGFCHINYHVPLCDMETFKGDYLKWPSFCDLFTAVYKNNKCLSKVEKLFHLNAKTSVDAK